MATNYEHITTGWNILIEVLAPYVARELRNRYGNEWWSRGVLGVLYESHKRDLPEYGEDGELTSSLDIQRCLILIDHRWGNVFRHKLDREHHIYAKELIPIRNKWAHKGSGDFTSSDAWRALDTMARLAEKIDKGAAEQLNALIHSVHRTPAEASATTHENPANIDTSPRVLSQADRIRRHIIEFRVKPWRKSGEKQLYIRAGDVVRSMRLGGNAPNVCSVLRGRKLQQEAGIVLIDHTEPCPSTTTVFRYRQDGDSP